MRMRLMVQRIFLIFGGIFFSIGVAGVFLPVLPATPFLLLAAACFSRGSERWHNYLINHKTLGPPIRSWQEHGVISKKAKIGAVVAILISSALVYQNGQIPNWGLVGYSIVIVGVLAFILSRPSRVA